MDEQARKSQIPFAARLRLRCEDIEEILDWYLDNELVPVLQDRMERHLRECVCCRKLVDESSEIRAVARSLRDAPIPPGVQTRLRQALERRVGHRSSPLHPTLTLVRSTSGK